ncbi:MAG: PQQ-binding-like beta-propeller repeat protein, partial [Candidatus Hydrogenedentota bacterium]
VMSPVLAGELIVGSSGLGTVGDRLVAVRPPDEKNDSAEVAYRIKKSIPLVPTAVYKDGLIFLTSENGAVSCVDAETGEYVWRERTGGKFLGSPILVDGRLFCTDRRGDIFVLAAGKTFELLARNSLGDDSYATPAVANGSLYIRTLTQLMSIGGEK